MSPTIEKPLDPMQATQRLAWLDEERRRDHSELARLAQELASVLAVVKDQAVRMRETGDRLGAVESTLTRLPRIEDAITLARSELIPLRDTDIRLQDDLARQSKDHQVQNDQAARLFGENNARLDALARSIDGLANRLSILEAQRKELTERSGDLSGRLDVLARSAESLAGRLHLLETREHEHVSRAAALQAQITRLESNQGKALEEVKRSVARVEGLVLDIQQIRREVILAQQEYDKRRKEDVAAFADQREAMARVQRRAEETAAGLMPIDVRVQHVERAINEQQENLVIVQRRAEETAASMVPIDVRVQHVEKAIYEQQEHLVLVQHRAEETAASMVPVDVRVQNLEQSMLQLPETAHRLLAAEEKLEVVRSMYSSLQEVEDRHWGTDIPQILDGVEETRAISQATAATVQELVAGEQSTKEDVRAFKINLAEEHTFTENLAAALRGFLEEDLQSHLAITQKQLQALRRMANAPVEGDAQLS